MVAGVNYGTSEAVWATLNARQVEQADELQALELSRLDALHYAVWDKALSGDIKAIETSLRVIERRVKVLGLDRLNGSEKPPAGRFCAELSDELVAGGHQAVSWPVG